MSKQTESIIDTNFSLSRELQSRAHHVIPGGCHTSAKGDDQYPQFAPGFISRGRGSHVWDVDDNEFIEYGMGLRSVTLGHAYPSVVAAARKAMQLVPTLPGQPRSRFAALKRFWKWCRTLRWSSSPRMDRRRPVLR